MNKKLLQYGICTVFGGIISYMIMDAQGLFIVWGNTTEVMLILCDAFFVPGILLTMFGALVWVAQTGFFDAIAYAFRTASHIILPFVNRDRKTFYDYKIDRAEKRKSTPYFILVVGMGYLLVSVICLFIWMSL